MNGAKIRMIRELRGFSQENMAVKLGITQASYSRMESNQTKLDTIMLEKLAKEFGVSVVDILSNEPTVVNFSTATSAAGPGYGENFYSFQKDMIDKIILSKDHEINSLKEIIAGLVKDKDALIQLLQSKAK